MGTWAGEPGLDRARAAASSRRARSSWGDVSVLTSRGRTGSGMGGPGVVVLLGYDLVELGWQAGAYRRDGVLLAGVRDGALELAAAGRQPGRGQRVEGMPGLFCRCHVRGLLRCLRRMAEHGRRAQAAVRRPQAGQPDAVPTRWSRPRVQVCSGGGAGIWQARQDGPGWWLMCAYRPGGRSSRAHTMRSPSLVVSVPQLSGPASASTMSSPWGRSSPGLQCQGPPRSSHSIHR